MKLKRLILLGLFLTSGILSAQTDFRPGYIISAAGDTLYGQIDYRGDMLMGSICRFKDAGNKIVSYSAYDIKAYRFIDSKYYVSRTIENKTVFLEYLIKGKIDMYYYCDETGDHYYLEKDNSGLTEIPYDQGVKYDEKEQVRVTYETKKHIGILNYYMQDAPDLQSEIQKVKRPEHQNLIRLAEDYHHAVCKGEECIVYETKKPVFKINPEILTGFLQFKNTDFYKDYYQDDFADKNYLLTGFIANLWIPRANEKIFLRTGILYATVDGLKGGNINYVKIPLHIGYMAPATYRIRPSFSMGLFLPSYSGGVVIRLDKSINAGIQGWFDFNPNRKFTLIPKDLYWYSVVGSLYLEM